MQKLPASIRKDFKMPHLYRDDLEAIEKILKEELHAQSFSIKIGRYRYDSISQIDSKIGPVVELDIETHQPYVAITFNKHSAYLYVSDDEINTLGAISKIEQIIGRRERKWRSTSAEFAIWLSSGSAVLFLFAIVVSLSGKHLFSVYSPLLAFLFFIGFFLACTWGRTSYRQKLYEFCKIEFIEKKNRTSFWIRKKDDILVAIISAFFGAILGVLGTLFVQTLYIH